MLAGLRACFFLQVLLLLLLLLLLYGPCSYVGGADAPPPNPPSPRPLFRWRVAAVLYDSSRLASVVDVPTLLAFPQRSEADVITHPLGLVSNS